MTDIDLIDENINPSNFEHVLYDDLPKLFVGVKLKHQFDKETFCGRKDSKNIAHIGAFDGTEKHTFLSGVFKAPSAVALKLFDDINSIENIDWDTIYKKYKKILRKYNLSCESNYSYLLDGIFPIDPIHYESLVDDDTTVQTEIEQLMDSLIIPWYLMPDIKIFILGKCNAFLHYNIGVNNKRF